MNTNQEIARCLGVGTTGKKQGQPCTRFGARKHYGFCSSHAGQGTQEQVDRWQEAQRAIEVAQTTGIHLMKQMEALAIELADVKARNKQLEEQQIATEREVELTRELSAERLRTEEAQGALANAMELIAELKLTEERLRLLEASM